MKTVLLTGATGSIGLETLKELVKHLDKFKVRVLELKNGRSKRFLRKYKNKIDIVWGSVTDSRIVRKAASGVDYVIHLAAIIPPLADKKPELARMVNVGGTKNIIEVLKNKKNAFLIYSSSISVYGDRVKNFMISVRDKLKPSMDDYYAKTKIEAEDIIKSSGIDYTIFRFTGVMATPKVDPLLFHMPLDTKFELSTTRDTAYALVSALDHKKQLSHKTFNLAGGPQCRVVYRDFLKKSLNIYGLDFNKIPGMAFATHNFHCGYLKDSNKLNKILHFQRDTLSDYYEILKSKSGKVKVFLSKIFKNIIIKNLVRLSDPLKALKTGDRHNLKRFYDL